MSFFNYQEGRLHAEQCDLHAIAETFGSPTFVYSKRAITSAYNRYAEALGSHDGMICYAVKANSNLAVLQVLAHLGAGFDIVSSGELKRVLKAGGSPDRIIFSGVGKTAVELKYALEVGIHCFNVESQAEITRLNEVAAAYGRVANISLRVNPNVDAKTHPYISTGLKENKFGVDILEAVEIYKQAAECSHLNIVGVDCHIGSQLTDISPFLDALDKVLLLVDELEAAGIALKHIDLGGGIGVTYKDETPPDIQAYLNHIKTRLGHRQLGIILEPGRSIVANAGVMLMQVEFLKPTAHTNFAIVDAAMNDNIRPALYQAWQEVQPLNEPVQPATQTWDIVGPVCETGDFLAKGRKLHLQAGDRLALMSSGAYGFVMSSNYNSRGRAAEVLVDGDAFHLVRERENFDDLIRGEKLL